MTKPGPTLACSVDDTAARESCVPVRVASAAPSTRSPKTMGYARILPIAKPPRQVYSSGPDIGLPPVTVDPDRLRTELERACEDAGLDPSRWVVWIVDGVPPAGTTPIAYLQPAGEVRTDTVIVFRAVGVKRARPHRLAAHRLAVWRLLPGLPDAALGPMLRHEV